MLNQTFLGLVDRIGTDTILRYINQYLNFLLLAGISEYWVVNPFMTNHALNCLFEAQRFSVSFSADNRLCFNGIVEQLLLS